MFLGKGFLAKGRKEVSGHCFDYFLVRSFVEGENVLLFLLFLCEPVANICKENESVAISVV